jgi:hypothetical protein
VNPDAFPSLGTFVDRTGKARAFRVERHEGNLLFGSYVIDGELINEACVPLEDFTPDQPTNPTDP